MKSINALILFVVSFALSSTAQTIHTITNSGFTYSPDSVNANVGDQVTFNTDFSMHPLHEVSSATWAANGSTQLAGGFSATTGSTATFTMTQAGTRYYVCANHVSLGMKGRIFVSNPNGIESIPSVAALLYPNPSNQQLHIIPVSTGYFSYAMTDMLGRKILEDSEYAIANSAISINISAIPEGNYILTMTNAEGQVSTRKIHIAH